MNETTITLASQPVGFYEGCTVMIDGTSYKVKSSTATTLTIYKASALERLGDWLRWKYDTLKWWIIEKYYDLTDRFAESPEEYNEDLD